MEHHLHGHTPPVVPDSDTNATPTSVNNQRILAPSPLPIASPHLSSPLPLLPSLPPPASVNTASKSHLLPPEPYWEHTVTMQELEALLKPLPSSHCPLLHSLMGSLSLLLHFVYYASQDKQLGTVVS